MSKSKKIKEDIKNSIIKIIEDKQYIVSTTIVGSFLDSTGLDGISDIDIVIIVEKLNKNIFDEINNSFQKIKSSEFGLDEYDIIINNTFGPLKFDAEKIIVFHLMIYDIEGHREHVEQSPFTCISWENYNPIMGIPLRLIYPTLNLQYTDILESRRGLLSYLRDIDNGSITFRKYVFNDDNKPEFIKESFELNDKHDLEYSYHITYHLLNNFYKIITRKIDSLDRESLIKFYLNFSLLPRYNVLFFKELFLWKKKGGKPPSKIIENTRLFINDFFLFVENCRTSSKTISFRRHEKTVLNDGTYLGVRRDPEINLISKKVSGIKYEIGYHSDLLRSSQTINYYHTLKSVKCSLLNEIDYGLAEGLNINKLKLKFPDVILEWEKGKDPKFPEGECQKDVLHRVKSFLEDKLDIEKDSLVITHLVVLRMVLYNYLKLDLKNIYKVNIEHLKGFDIISFNGYLSVEISNDNRSKFRKQLSILND